MAQTMTAWLSNDGHPYSTWGRVLLKGTYACSFSLYNVPFSLVHHPYIQLRILETSPLEKYLSQVEYRKYKVVFLLRLNSSNVRLPWGNAGGVAWLYSTSTSAKGMPCSEQYRLHGEKTAPRRKHEVCSA